MKKINIEQKQITQWGNQILRRKKGTAAKLGKTPSNDWFFSWLVQKSFKALLH